MKFERRYIPLVIIMLFGIIYAWWFSTGFVSLLLSDRTPDWDIITFVPGLADVDNLYLIFGTLVWQLLALLFSVGIAGFFMILHRTVERGRTFKIGAAQSKLSMSKLIRRAVVPAMFAFSIGEIAIRYFRQLSLGIFQPPNLTEPLPVRGIFDLFSIKTLHLCLLFLPLALVIFIPTWILNDFIVISYKTDAKSGGYSDPQKVGQWVSGLLSGFSIFAFPIAYLTTFIIDPYFDRGPGAIVNTFEWIVYMMTITIIMLIAFVLPVILAYELGKPRIAKSFYNVANRLKVENSSLLRSMRVDDRPVPLDEVSLPGDDPVPMDNEEEASQEDL
ncbi:MAG: hypothetical protein ACFFEF_19310 [Candidatus Thorarchaeota archaeon]